MPTGLVPVVVQDDTGDVLMLAYMNEDALERTRETAERTSGAAAGRHSGARARPPATSKKSSRSTSIATRTACWYASTRSAPAVIPVFPTCFYRESTTENQLVETESQRFNPESIYGDHALADHESWIGAYRWLADNDLAGVSRTSRLLRETNVPVLSARVADELRELAGVVSGDHVHETRPPTPCWRARKCMYWLALTAIRAGLTDSEIVEAIRTGTSTAVHGAPVDLPPKLRELADEWQRAFFRALGALITRTVAEIHTSAAATDTSLSAMLAHDLADLRARPYLAEYFAAG